MLCTVFFTRVNVAGSDTVLVAISFTGSTTAGRTYSLTCFATLHSNNPPLQGLNIPSPTFEWFYGPNGNAPLPPGLTTPQTVFSEQSHLYQYSAVFCNPSVSLRDVHMSTWGWRSDEQRYCYCSRYSLITVNTLVIV